MKKKIFMSAIATVLVLASLTACGNKTNTPNTDVTEANTQEEENLVEEERKEEEVIITDISDFSATIESIKDEQVIGSSETHIVDINNGTKYYAIRFNHQDDIKEVNFYRIPDYAAKNDNYSLENREYIETYYDYYSLNQIIIKYDLPKDGTGLLASFLTKGGQVFEYSIINDDEKIDLKELEAMNAEDMIQYIED